MGLVNFPAKIEASSCDLCPEPSRILTMGPMERVFLASLLLTWAFVLYQALYGNGMQEMPTSAQLFLACDLVAATYGTLLMVRKFYIRSLYPNRSCMYVTARGRCDHRKDLFKMCATELPCEGVYCRPHATVLKNKFRLGDIRFSCTDIDFEDEPGISECVAPIRRREQPQLHRDDECQSQHRPSACQRTKILREVSAQTPP